MSVKHAYLVPLVILGWACSASGTSSASAVPRRGSLLSAEELAAFEVEGKTAYDAVERLRKRWLAPRGVQSLIGASDSSEYAIVFVDGHPSGRLGSLREIPLYQVGDIRYYDVGEAAATFGTRGASSGVIEVRMKSASRE